MLSKSTKNLYGNDNIINDNELNNAYLSLF